VGKTWVICCLSVSNLWVAFGWRGIAGDAWSGTPADARHVAAIGLHALVRWRAAAG
jgi:hypothetical protein